jgi:hypothetical protein
MAHVITNSISETECIGDSLNTKINPNFLNLDNSVQSLSTNKNIFTGNVGIGITNPGAYGKLAVDGSLFLNGETSPFSTVGGVPSADEVNRTNTFITFGPAGTLNDWAYLRQIGQENVFHMSLDLLDDADSVSIGQAFSIRIISSVPNPDSTPLTRVHINGTGNVGIGTSSPNSKLTINGSFATSAPITVNTSSYTVPASATSLTHIGSTNSGYILPSPSACPGQWLYIKTVTAVILSSTSANVEPLSSTTPINRILPQTGTAAIGKWVNLQSDGTDWIAMAGN